MTFKDDMKAGVAKANADLKAGVTRWFEHPLPLWVIVMAFVVGGVLGKLL